MAVRWKSKKIRDPMRDYLVADNTILGMAFYDAVRISKRAELPQNAVAVAVEIRHGSVTVFFVDDSGEKSKYEFCGKRVSQKEFQAKYGLLKGIKRRRIHDVILRS